MRKNGKCPNCCPEGGAVLDAVRTDELDSKPVWRCRNCDHETPRRVYVTKKRLAREERAEKTIKMLGQHP